MVPTERSDLVEATEADKKLVENERAKLSATYVNGIAIAVFAVGGLAPLISAVAPKDSGIQIAQATSVLHPVPWGILGITAFCWIVSGALHWAARGHLRDLRS